MTGSGSTAVAIAIVVGFTIGSLATSSTLSSVASMMIVGTWSAAEAVVGAGTSSISAIWTVSPGARPSGFEIEAPGIAATPVSVSTGFGGAVGTLAAVAVLVEVVLAVLSESGFEAVAGTLAAVAVVVLVEAALAVLSESEDWAAAAVGLEAVEFDSEGEAALLGIGIEFAIPGLSTGMIGAGAEAGCANTVGGVATFAFPSAAVGRVAVVSDAATVAESTFAVMFGDPAELVVEPVVAGVALTGAGAGFAATALAAFTGAGVALDGCDVAAEDDANGACFVLLDEDAVVVVTPGLVFSGTSVYTLIDGAEALATGKVEALFVVTTIVDAAGGVSPVAGCVFCTVTAFPGTEAVAGTLPAPGVPIPGNTVPSCKLPVFGCAAGGVVIGAAALACVGAAGCFSGKLIGGNFGGTGIGACATGGAATMGSLR